MNASIGTMRLNLPAPLQIAFEEAEAAAARGEVPVGAVVADKAGTIIARAGNRTLELKDPTAHAEMLAIRRAAEILGSERLVGCDLHVTLEPCAMCAAAISFARFRRLYFAAADEKMGAVENGPRFYAQATCHHAPDVYSGLGEDRARLLLRDFFRSRRE
jgi:tRNA(adenine34) deaminase